MFWGRKNFNILIKKGGYYGPKSYAAPPVKVFKPAPAPIFRHEIPVVPVVRHVADKYRRQEKAKLYSYLFTHF